MNMNMSQAPQDPLRYLKLKKKRESNKQKMIPSIQASRESRQQEVSQFVLPSFTSLNSLQNEQSNRIKKTYNPMKYYNPEVEQYLNKMKALKVANSLIMPEAKQQQKLTVKNLPNFEKQTENQMLSMMTFSKNTTVPEVKLTDNQSKPILAFDKPGLRKSGSVKMMQKLKETLPLNFQTINTNQQGINPWELPENTGEDQQLHSCEICKRNFNIKSYEKHVKICEKVFFQKRKPFKSRPSSLDNKATPK